MAISFFNHYLKPNVISVHTLINTLKTFLNTVMISSCILVGLSAAQANNFDSSVNIANTTNANITLTPNSIDSLSTNKQESVAFYRQQMNKEQKVSFDLLRYRYQACYSLKINNATHTTLPIEYSIDIYENHDDYCGGDPSTAPRVDSFYIDKYGRIFKYNVLKDTLDLQYKFKETPIVTTYIPGFTHPTKDIFNLYAIKLNKVEKWGDNTFVVFYVAQSPMLTIVKESRPAAPTNAEYARFKAQDKALRSLFRNLLRANSYWDFMIRTEDGYEYYIEGNKRKVIDPMGYIEPDGDDK